MPATLIQVVKQFQQEWTAQLEPDAILTVCQEVGYQWRERCLDPVTTTQLFFVQVVNGTTACTHLRHLTKLPVTASAYCHARTRLPLEVFTRLLRAVGDNLQQEPLDERSWLGHRTFFADGSSFSMSDTPELHEHFGQPGGQQPGCGLPVAHVMGLLHAGTGMALKMLSAPLRTNDLPQAVELHPDLRAGDVLVALRTRDGVKPVYVSPGHLCDVDTAIAVVLQATPKYRLPAPIRAAHEAANTLRRAQTT